MLEINRVDELNTTIDEIQRRWGHSSIQTLKAQTSSFSPVVISTGLEIVDSATQIGGLPRGITALSGVGSSGILTLALTIMSHAQRSGHVPVMFDLSRTFDPHFAQRCGLDIAHMLIVRPYSLEEGFKIAFDLVESSTSPIIVFDYALDIELPIHASELTAPKLQRLAIRANVRSNAIICLAPHYSHHAKNPFEQQTALNMQVMRSQWHQVAGDITGCTLHLTVKRNKFAPAGQTLSQHIKLKSGSEIAS